MLEAEGSDHILDVVSRLVDQTRFITGSIQLLIYLFYLLIYLFRDLERTAIPVLFLTGMTYSFILHVNF
jgi:hypothetical protein